MLHQMLLLAGLAASMERQPSVALPTGEASLATEKFLDAAARIGLALGTAAKNPGMKAVLELSVDPDTICPLTSHPKDGGRPAGNTAEELAADRRNPNAIAALGGMLYGRPEVQLQGARTLDTAFPAEIFDRLTRDDEHVYEEDLVKEMGNTDSDKGTFATFCDGTIEIEGLGATPVINVGGVPVPPLFLGWVTKQDGGWFGQIYNRAEMAAFKGFCGPLIAGAPTKGYGNKLSVDALTALLSPLVPESGKQIQGPPAFKERFAAYSAYLANPKVAGALTEENILAAKVAQLERCSNGEPSIYTLAYQPIYASTESAALRTASSAEMLLRMVGTGKQGAPYEDLQMFFAQAPGAYRRFIAAQIAKVHRDNNLMRAVDHVSVNVYASLIRDREFIEVISEDARALGTRLGVEILEYDNMTKEKHPINEPGMIEALKAFQALFSCPLFSDDLNTEGSIRDAIAVLEEGVRVNFKLDAMLLQELFLTSHAANAPFPTTLAARRDFMAKSVMIAEELLRRETPGQDGAFVEEVFEGGETA